MSIDYRKPTVSGSPVSLTKERPTVSLMKQTGQLRVSLTWQSAPPQAPGGFLKRLTTGRGIDLDLGCLYELTDGTKGVVQALGGAFGSLDQPPYLWLNGDDRSGAGGEEILINLANASKIKRVLVFACIYEGVASFDQAQGVVVLTPASGPPIEVRLDEQAGSSRMCAIALIEGDAGGPGGPGGPGDLSIRREVRYLQGGQDVLDREYGWGLRWTRGRK